MKKNMFQTPMLRSNLCDYSDVYILVKDTIDLLAADANESKAQREFVFKNNAPFSLCILKIISTFVHSEEDHKIWPFKRIICYNIEIVILLHQKVCGR